MSAQGDGRLCSCSLLGEAVGVSNNILKKRIIIKATRVFFMFRMIVIAIDVPYSINRDFNEASLAVSCLVSVEPSFLFSPDTAVFVASVRIPL